MQSLIWGAGAIGGTLGAYLARAGADITMVDAVGEHVGAITRHGLRVTGPIDEFTVRVPAVQPQAVSGTWDEIILATKAHHTDVAVHALLPHLAAGGYVVSAQNGLNELAIAEVVGAEEQSGNRQLPATGPHRGFIPERTLYPRDRISLATSMKSVTRTTGLRNCCGIFLAKVAKVNSANRASGYFSNCRCNSRTNVVKPVRRSRLSRSAFRIDCTSANASSISWLITI